MSNKKKLFFPPVQTIDPPSQEVIEKMANMSKKERKQFKRSDAYRKYVQPVLDREKAQKKDQLREWWWNKGIVILNTILALIAAITGVIGLLR